MEALQWSKAMIDPHVLVSLLLFFFFFFFFSIFEKLLLAFSLSLSYEIIYNIGKKKTTVKKLNPLLLLP